MASIMQNTIKTANKQETQSGGRNRLVNFAENTYLAVKDRSDGDKVTILHCHDNRHYHRR